MLDDEILLGCKMPNDEESNMDLRPVTHLGFGSNRFGTQGTNSSAVVETDLADLDPIKMAAKDELDVVKQASREESVL